MAQLSLPILFLLASLCVAAFLSALAGAHTFKTPGSRVAFYMGMAAVLISLPGVLYFMHIASAAIPYAWTLAFPAFYPFIAGCWAMSRSIDQAYKHGAKTTR